MTKLERNANNFNRKKERENGEVFTFTEITDVLKWALADETPSSEFSDAECNLWSAMRRIINA